MITSKEFNNTGNILYKGNFDSVSLNYIVSRECLSEDFIEEYKDLINWGLVSRCQRLSESFIEKHKDLVDWYFISRYQKLSEKFIEKHKDLVRWCGISCYQVLSESFIEKFSEFILWDYISRSQNLSESFIERNKHKLDWGEIFCYQNLSRKMLKNSDKYLVEIYNKYHKKLTKREKLQEMKLYAKKYNLKFDGKFLYAYRDHDKWGRGFYNKAFFYEPEKYYRDWHCDMDNKNVCSFGFGITHAGNTPIKVSIDDWGILVKGQDICRVWGFTVLKK